MTPREALPVLLSLNVLLPFGAVLSGINVYQYVMLLITLMAISLVIAIPGGVEIVLGLPRSEPPATDLGR